MNDITVIRGYVAICKRIADDRCADLDDAVDRLADAFEAVDVARDAAEARRAEAERALEYVERLAIFAAQAMAGDVAPELVSDAAQAIRRIVGDVPCLGEKENAA